MIISNYKSLATNKLRKNALDIAIAGIESVMPDKLLPSKIKMHKGNLIIDGNKFDISKGKIYVIGGGKASGLMAKSLEKIISQDRITAGFVNSKSYVKTNKIVVKAAGHPIPDEQSITGTKNMIELLKKVTSQDTVICLISGGGSALMTLPPEGMPLSDVELINNLLVRCGARPYEMNIVRKHFCQVKGGKLLRYTYPARVISLIISDELLGKDDVASRPTKYDESSFKDAYTILKKYNLLDKIPTKAKAYIERGIQGNIPETVKKGDALLKNVYNFTLADNKTALNAMHEKSKSLGFNTQVLDTITDETKISAEKVANILSTPIQHNRSLIFSSETKVNINGQGKGGRNQHFISCITPRISKLNNTVVLAIGSDGIDFLDGVGGAIADNTTYDLIKKKKLNINKFLKENDTYNLHKKLQTLILMNPTNTNVGDLHVCLQEK